MQFSDNASLRNSGVHLLTSSTAFILANITRMLYPKTYLTPSLLPLLHKNAGFNDTNYFQAYRNKPDMTSLLIPVKEQTESLF